MSYARNVYFHSLLSFHIDIMLETLLCKENRVTRRILSGN